jgi:hypothetical protein
LRNQGKIRKKIQEIANSKRRRNIFFVKGKNKNNTHPPHPPTRKKPKNKNKNRKKFKNLKIRNYF